MSIASIITRGFGPSGSVSKIITGGYASAPAVTVQTFGRVDSLSAFQPRGTDPQTYHPTGTAPDIYRADGTSQQAE